MQLDDHRRRRLLAGAALAALLAGSSLLPVPARAMGVELTTEQLAAQAGLVVHARVKQVQGRWNADRSAIYSEVKLQVLGMVQSGGGGAVSQATGGAAVGEMTIQVPGGEADGIGMLVAEAPQPKVGQEAVIFLGQPVAAIAQGRLGANQSTLTVIGNQQGWHPVERGMVGTGAQRLGVDQFLATAKRSMRN